MMLLSLLLAAAAHDARASDLKRDAVLDFASCVDKQAPHRVAQLLAVEPGSPREHDLAYEVASVSSTCLTDRRILSFPTTLIRGQLAELAFRRDASLSQTAAPLPALPIVKPDMGSIDKFAARAGRGADSVTADAFRSAYARCVVGSNPAAVARLTGTKPDSPEERAAILASGATLMACIPQGISYHIIPAELRPYLLSELYYRVVSNPVPRT